MVQLLSLKKLVESKNFLNFTKLIHWFTNHLQLKKRILCSAPDYDSKKWACDGLAYLTLDADIKTALANDPASLSVLLELTNVTTYYLIVNFLLKSLYI